MFYNRGMEKRWKIPLRSLEVFEAAARLGGAAPAARELGITRSAVGQHLRNLEDRIGAPLFERGARPARPTRAARRLLPTVTKALDMMNLACVEIARRESGRVVIAAPPTDASVWLIPRTMEFCRRHPDIRLSVQSDAAAADFDADEADAALRYGGGEHPGLYWEKLADEFVAPLCAPRYFRENPVADADDLLHCALIDGRAEGGMGECEWQGWLSRLGVDGEPQNIVMSANRVDQVLSLARAGWGIALGHGLLAIDDLRNGLLAPALPFSLPTGRAHYFVCPHSARKNPGVSRFADWLRAEFEDHRRAMREFFPPPRKPVKRKSKARVKR